MSNTIIKKKAPAKLNLSLEIIKRYENGFHEINSIFIKSEKLFDEIEIEFQKDRNSIVIECDDDTIPTDERNICYKVADEFLKKTKKNIGLVIKIKKVIPVFAGLGGGSSDGGSVLIALNEYYDNILTSEELVQIASNIGKDIPFFLINQKVAFVSGAGEKIEIIENFPKLHLLLIVPNVEISTPWAYNRLDEVEWFMNYEGRKRFSLTMKNDVKNLEDVAKNLYNDFSLTAKEKCDTLETIQNALRTFGALGVSISGKGPTTFGIFESHTELILARKNLEKQYTNCFISEF